MAKEDDIPHSSAFVTIIIYSLFNVVVFVVMLLFLDVNVMLLLLDVDVMLSLSDENPSLTLDMAIVSSR